MSFPHVDLKTLLGCISLHADRTLEWPLSSVNLQVLLVVVVSLEGHATNLTTERLLPSVSQLVVGKSVSSPEPLTTQLALVRFLPSVDHHVVFEGSRLCEPRVANLTLKLFLVGRVDLRVLPQVAVGEKPFATLLALEGLLLSMPHHVQFQQVRPGEGFATYLATDVLVLGMDLVVFPQCGLFGIFLLTNITFVSPFLLIILGNVFQGPVGTPAPLWLFSRLFQIITIVAQFFSISL